MAEEQTNNEAQDKVAADSGPAGPEQKQTTGSRRWQRYKDWYLARKKWTIPATVLAVILLLAAIPFTRYNLAGLIHKTNLEIKVVDAAANTPVSGATVSIGSIQSETNGTGVATLHGVRAGRHQAAVSKKYYKDATAGVLAPILSQKTVPSIELTATGRQVKVDVTNLITKKPLQNASITAAGTTSKTDSRGSATLVLPAGTTEQKATLSLSGYNDADVTIKVSNDKIQDNPFTLTPAGKVYFLSKLSGKIDVVKTNLDGSDRQTVLAGTGNEDDQNTVLLASRDWKYLALLSRRAGNAPTLYLIDTSNDSLSTIDEGNADFSPDGWVGDNFVYTVTRTNIQLWTANRQALKSFNAPTNKLVTLDQTTATGSDNTNYVSQILGGVYDDNGQVYYILNWSSGLDSINDITSKQATFNSINPDGTAKKAIKSFGQVSGVVTSALSLDERVNSPGQVELHFTNGANDSFYTYANGQVKNDPSTTTENYYSSTPTTYLESPSGNQTFWSESRDGKNTLFIGNQDGNGGKQIATLSEYFTYGWYTDNYLLVSKNSSELYIMPVSGAGNAVKISDYNKPARNFYGYGGGYGGL